MKKIYLHLIFLLLTVTSYAAPRYWVGGANGNWNNAANWSATSSGPGGAGVPGISDDAFFNNNARVNVDVSPVINLLRVNIGANVTLFTSVPTDFTVMQSLFLSPNTILKDSTAADVPFNFIFNPATNATASLFGNWIFEGGVPVTGTNGARFTADPGTQVSVTAVTPVGGGGGTMILRKNTGIISSNPSTLIFRYNSTFVLDNNPEGIVPNATWFADSVRLPLYSGFLGGVASTLMITGNIGVLKHGATTLAYGRVVVDLPLLTADASLALTNGSWIKGNLEIRNTNNFTLTLLAPTSPTSVVDVEVGTANSGFNFAGNLNISGNTKVALATATDAAPATNYRLHLQKNFSQESGNFSLQDFDGALGSSTLSLRKDLLQTGGTFYTNSSATGGARFIVEMDDPYFTTGPSGLFNSIGRISMSSGTIDNGRGVVTLRLNHNVYFNPGDLTAQNGVLLQSPLAAGRLDLFRSPLNTTATNILTLTDPDPATAIIVGATGRSYVNGPMKRLTNSTQPYVFPLGKGNTIPASFVFDSCVIVPSSAEPSMYQAEYFKTAYIDVANVNPPLSGVSTVEYWDISKIYGADASVRLNLNAKVPGTTNQDVLVVANYQGGQWINVQGSSLIPGDASSGSVISKPLSDFGPFTFGYYPVVIDPPVYVKCPSDTTVNADPNGCSALLHFKAESSENANLVYKIGSTVITSPYSFEKGTTIVDVTASNSSSSETCSFKVTVNDVQAPVISGASASPATLSPADSELKDVFVDYTVTDNCGPVTTTLSVTSNQPQDGDVDWELIDEHHVKLRAESSAQDRIYTITITSTDQSGNQAVQTVTVTVPKETVTDKKIKLKVKVMPNPSRTYFTLNVSSNSDKLITMQVFDLLGRIKEVRRFYPDATIRLGDNYRPGIYFVKFTQGNADIYVTLVKLPH